jgi:exosortase
MLKSRATNRGRSAEPASAVGVNAAVESNSDRPTLPRIWLSAGAVGLLIATIWSYWPTLAAMVGQWIHQPDYSHGFLVLPLATFFLWIRRAQLDQIELRPSVLGGVLLLLAAAARIAASYFYLNPLDGWTLPIWIAGIVWLVYGWSCLRWAAPAIAFLWFMVPLPYSAETMLSIPLQRVATKLSTEALVFLGQPAVAEGNVIWVGENRLGIEEACSGLRILVGIYALAFAFVLFSRWSWWQKALALAAALPIAIIANVIRVVVTGLLYQFSSSEMAHKFMHDFSGLAMIPLAAAMFWLFLIYLDRLFPEVEELSSLEAARDRL